MGFPLKARQSVVTTLLSCATASIIYTILIFLLIVRDRLGLHLACGICLNSKGCKIVILTYKTVGWQVVRLSKVISRL